MSIFYGQDWLTTLSSLPFLSGNYNNKTVIPTSVNMDFLTENKTVTPTGVNMEFLAENHISPIANKRKRQSVNPPEHGELLVASIDDFKKPYNEWKLFSLFNSPFDQQYLPDPPKDSPESSTSFQDKSKSVEIQFSIKLSGFYEIEQDTSSIEVLTQDCFQAIENKMVPLQDCSYYKIPRMVVNDLGSVG